MPGPALQPAPPTFGQRVILGEGQRDVIAHATGLQDLEELRQYVGEVAERLDSRLAGVELELRGTIAHRSLVRYDAYNELSGQQSMSIALLDGTPPESCSRASTIAIRHAYTPSGAGRRSELELSPEEAEAVRLALSPADAATKAPWPERWRLPQVKGMPARSNRRGAAAGRLSRSGGNVQRGGPALERTAGSCEPVALPTIYDTAVAARGGGWNGRATDRELARRDRSQSRSTCSQTSMAIWKSSARCCLPSDTR